MEKWTISFDFDETLSHIELQEIAYNLIQESYKVIICTARSDDPEKINNSDLFEVVFRLGLSVEDVIFCAGESKYKFLKKVPNLLFHLDDDFMEVKGVTHNTNVIGLHVLQANWYNWKIKGADVNEEYEKVRVIMRNTAQKIKRENPVTSCIL